MQFTKNNPELITYIFSFLSVKDVYRCSIVCKDWYASSQEEVLWESLTRRYYNHTSLLWKEIFKMHHRSRVYIISREGEDNTFSVNGSRGTEGVLRATVEDITTEEYVLDLFHTSDPDINRLCQGVQEHEVIEYYTGVFRYSVDRFLKNIRKHIKNKLIITKKCALLYEVRYTFNTLEMLYIVRIDEILK